jgi:hypothetical protein
VPTEPFLDQLNQFSEVFYRPSLNLLNDYCREEKTSGLSDARFLLLGLARCIGQYDSGRDFLQKLSDDGDPVPRSTFFNMLTQARRLRVIQEVSERTMLHAAKEMAEIDWLKSVPGLEHRQVWAIDGHQIKHACHALLDKGGKRVPPGSLYALDLRKGLMYAMGTHQGNGQRSHEVKVFKELFSAQIARKGFPSQPIMVVDMGFIDNVYWTQLQLNSPHAPVVITRQKDNMNPLHHSTLTFDRADPHNAGVVSHERVVFNHCLGMYRVTYKDPENGAEFVFLTSDGTLMPGVVALLYRLRWKIEKTYNTCKSKLHETKGWGNSDTAQHLQAHFTALTHNLLTLLQYKLAKEHAITEQKLLKKHDINTDKRILKGLPEHPFHLIARLALQLSCQFIRLVRNLLQRTITWNDALPLFHERLKKYL